MRSMIISLLSTLLLTTSSFSQNMSWPFPIPVQFHTQDPDGIEPFEPLEDNGEGRFFLLDQNRINAWAANQDWLDEGAIHLVDQNTQNNQWPNAEYNAVDYIIIEDLVFGPGQNQANVNLVIDSGVEVWFALRTNTQVNVNPDPNPADDLTPFQDDGEVTRVCTITINGNRRILHGDGAGMTNFSPWRDLDQFLLDYDNYPRNLPQAILGDDDADPWLDDPGIFFAGGLIINSPLVDENQVENSIELITFRNLIGGPAHGRNDNGRKWARWTLFEPIVENNLGNQDCFGIKLGNNGAGVRLTTVFVSYPMFNGIVMGSPATELIMTGGEISNTWLIAPEGQDANQQALINPFILPWGTDGINNGGYGAGDGLVIDDNANGANATLNGVSIRECSLSGIELLGVESILTGTALTITENGKHRRILTSNHQANTAWPHSAGVAIQCEGLFNPGDPEDPEDPEFFANISVSITGNSAINSNESNGIAIYPPDFLEDQVAVGLFLNGDQGTINLNENHWDQHANNHWWVDGDDDFGSGIRVASNGNFIYVSNAHLDDNWNYGMFLEDAIVDGADDNVGADHRPQGWRNKVKASNTTISRNGAHGHGFSYTAQGGIRIRESVLPQDGNIVQVFGTILDDNYQTGIIADTHADVLIDLTSSILNSTYGVSIIGGYVDLTVDNSSDIHDNRTGVMANGPESYYSGITIGVNNTSHIRQNTENGIHFEYVKGNVADGVTDTYVKVENNSTVNTNGWSGFYGFMTHNTDIIANSSQLSNNRDCGVFFDGDAERHIQTPWEPNSWARSCKDCQVILTDDSHTDNNLGENNQPRKQLPPPAQQLGQADQGGIIMYGPGHRVYCSYFSTSSGNGSVEEDGIADGYGVKIWGNDRALVQVWGGCSISNNVLSGIFIKNPEGIYITGSSISENGSFVGGVSRGWGIYGDGFAGTNNEVGRNNRWPDLEELTLNAQIMDVTGDYAIANNELDGVCIIGDVFLPDDAPTENDIDCYISIDHSIITGSGRHGVLLDLLILGHITIHAGTEITNNGMGPEGGNGLNIWDCFLSDLYLGNSIISGNETGVLLAAGNPPERENVNDPVNEFTTSLNCLMEGMRVEENQTGLFANDYYKLRLTVQPMYDQENNIIVPSIFRDNYMDRGGSDEVKWNMIVKSVPDQGIEETPDYTTLLIDATEFTNQVIPDPPNPPAISGKHLYLSGPLNGFAPFVGAAETDFATVRKCLFYGAQQALKMDSRADEQLPEANATAHVRNNFFDINEEAIRTEFGGIAGENPFATTSIFNNTIRGYVVPDEDPNTWQGDQNGIGLHIFYPTLDQNIRDNFVYSNIFQHLEFGIQNESETEYPLCPNIYYSLIRDIADANDNFPEGVQSNWPDINTDPTFEDLYSNARLMWNSPCINAGFGRPDGNGYTFADSTSVVDPRPDAVDPLEILNPPDIGACGGGYYAGILDHPSWNYMSGVVLTATPDDPLPGDEYELESNGTHAMTVNNNVTLSIESNSLFYGNPGAYLKISGAIDARGNTALWQNITPSEIYFTSKPGESSWGGVYFYGDNDAECFLEDCIIEKGSYNVRGFGGTSFIPFPINITGSWLMGADYNNLNSYGRYRYICGNIVFRDAGGDGIYLMSNSTLSSFHECLIVNNGLDIYNGTGVGVKLASSSRPAFTKNTITHNRLNGVYLSGTSPIWNGFGGIANLIFNNGGGDFGAQNGATGAEIYLTSSAQAQITLTNIWDARESVREGKFVYNNTAIANQNFTNNFWSDNQGDPPHGGENCSEWDQQENRVNFFQSAAGGSVDFGERDGEGADPDIDPDDEDIWQKNYIVGAEWIGELDGLDDLDLAFDLETAGEYREAVDCFLLHLQDEESDYLKFATLEHLASSWFMADLPLDSLRSVLYTYAEVEGRASELAFAARHHAGLSLRDENDLEDAITALEELRAEIPTYSDSIALEIDLAYLHASLEGEQIDMIGSGLDKRVDELWKLMDRDRSEIREQKRILPTEFALHTPYPNPFNSSIHLGYALPEATEVEFGIYDLAGRLVERLVNQRQEAGEYRLLWNGMQSATGLYFVRLKTGKRIETHRVLLIK